MKRCPIEFVGQIGQAIRRMFVSDLPQHHGQFVRQRQIARGLFDIGTLIEVLRDREDQLINRELRARFQPAADDAAIIDQLGADQRIVLRGFVVRQPV